MSTPTDLLAAYRRVRQRSLSVCAPPSAEAHARELAILLPAVAGLADRRIVFAIDGGQP
jgi:hypothetical protein